jgi:coenzyme F420-reducing hydrogenase alpha subunit
MKADYGRLAIIRIVIRVRRAVYLGQHVVSHRKHLRFMALPDHAIVGYFDHLSVTIEKSHL